MIKDRRGFTLIELIIVVAIVGALVGSSLFMLIKYKHARTLSLEKDKIVSFLKTAQESAISQSESSKWGVRFDNASPDNSFYALFYGDLYATSNIRNIIYLNRGLQFVDPTSSQAKDIIFNKLTGYPVSPGKIVIYNSSVATTTAEVNVSSTGVVTSKVFP